MLKDWLIRWLNLTPDLTPMEEKIASLQDRMDFLDNAVMTHHDAPNDGPSVPRDTPALGDVPDAHLGAQ